MRYWVDGKVMRDRIEAFEDLVYMMFVVKVGNKKWFVKSAACH